jgi:hypothetical protein
LVAKKASIPIDVCLQLKISDSLATSIGEAQLNHIGVLNLAHFAFHIAWAVLQESKNAKPREERRACKFAAYQRRFSSRYRNVNRAKKLRRWGECVVVLVYRMPPFSKTLPSPFALQRFPR